MFTTTLIHTNTKHTQKQAKNDLKLETLASLT